MTRQCNIEAVARLLLAALRFIVRERRKLQFAQERGSVRVKFWIMLIARDHSITKKPHTLG